VISRIKNVVAKVDGVEMDGTTLLQTGLLAASGGFAGVEESARQLNDCW
jgi:hypothetical protein